MVDFDEVTNENKTEHNPNWPNVPDHPYGILIIGDSGWIRKNKCVIKFNKQATRY